MNSWIQHRRHSVAQFILGFLAASTAALQAFDFGPEVIVSVPDQEMIVLKEKKVVAKYTISTSKFGVGDDSHSYKTPLGKLFVCNKIGDGLPEGAVLKGRSATGEVVAANSPGRDPIVTRVIWLRGLEEANKKAYNRCIYIHGTPDEKNLGKAASYGCIRMRSKDVVALYSLVQVGTHVTISTEKIRKLVPKDKPLKLDMSIALANSQRDRSEPVE